MNFPKIQNPENIFDMLIKQTKKAKGVQKDPFIYIDEFQQKCNNYFLSVYNNLPDYSNMNEYYLLMSKNICDESKMEKYKNHYLITIRLINQLAEKYKREISKKKQLKQKNKLQKEFLGRTKSIIKKIKNTNKILEEYSKYFRRISNPKDEFTVVLIGVPNSGKTTLLSEITSANPEINSYSFTTKSLNIGYFKKREEIIQVVDSPGLIHLELKDMNIIEKQVIVAIKTLADVIIFVYNQYQDNQIQINILEKIKKENPLPIYVFPAFGGKLNGYPHITKQKILNKEFEKQHI